MTKLTLTADTAGERLDAFLARSVEDLSRSAAQKLLEKGSVTISSVFSRIWSKRAFFRSFRPSKPISLQNRTQATLLTPASSASWAMGFWNTSSTLCRK